MIHIPPRVWVIGIASGWLLLLAPVLWPASWWFRVDRVFVHDAVAGSTPLMEVERAIVRPFRGRWIATIMRGGSRGFYAYCTARGQNDYRPDAMLPDTVDLNWWTWPVECKLPEGTYRLNTLWTIQSPLVPDKEVRITSNVFVIAPR